MTVPPGLTRRPRLPAPTPGQGMVTAMAAMFAAHLGSLA
jgi:hypothetical protein